MASIVLGAYIFWRGRYRYDPFSDDYEFEKAPTTRHLVDMKKRVDKEQLKAWLEEQEQVDKPNYGNTYGTDNRTDQGSSPKNANQEMR